MPYTVVQGHFFYTCDTPERILGYGNAKWIWLATHHLYEWRTDAIVMSNQGIARSNAGLNANAMTYHQRPALIHM